MKIAFSTAPAEFTDAVFTALKQALPQDELLLWHPGQSAPSPDLEVLLTTEKVDHELLANLPKLLLVHTLSDGYESVDLDAATELGIWVSHSPGDETGNADSVAEYTVLLILAAARRLNLSLKSIQDSSVKKPGNSPSLLQKTVCIVGPGSIGEKVAQRLLPFGVRLTAVDRHPSKAPKTIPTRPLEELKEAVADADFVVLCVRASKDTDHLFDASVFAAMKEGSVLVNIARGSVVDEKALFDAIKSGHLLGAGLDVLEEEPVQPQNPLLALSQIFVTPHVAGQTDVTIAGTAAYASEVLALLKTGEPIRSLLNEPESPRKILQKK